MAKCEVCGVSIGLFGMGRYWGNKDGTKCCSEKHSDEYNKSLLYKNSSNRNNRSNSNDEADEGGGRSDRFEF